MAPTIRPATPADAAALERYSALLVAQHHAFDPLRFMQLRGGYGRWLVQEAADPEAVVLVAELDGTVVGYAYGRLEERDWPTLRDACGGFHDLWVDASARGHGLGAALAEEMVHRLKALGAPRVVLTAAAKNEAAQRLFARLGWRPTMVELTRET